MYKGSVSYLFIYLLIEQIFFAQPLIATEQDVLKVPYFTLLSQTAINPTLSDAYVVQFDFVKQKMLNDNIVGYKAGLTSKAGQAKFNVDKPLHGVLFQSGQIKPQETVLLNNYYRLMLETEIGYVLNQAISVPIKNITELKSKIDYVVAIIELPDLAYESLKDVKGVDLIATNAAAASFIMGSKKISPNDVSLNQLAVSLSRNGKVINRGKGSDASGDQWQALLWLMNSSLKQGYLLEKGQLLITGALGKMLPAKVGNYEADFSALGKMSFVIN